MPSCRWMDKALGPVRGHAAPDRQHRRRLHRTGHGDRRELRAGVAPLPRPRPRRPRAVGRVPRSVAPRRRALAHRRAAGARSGDRAAPRRRRAEPDGGRRDEARSRLPADRAAAAIRRRCTTSPSAPSSSATTRCSCYDHVVGAEHADREPPLWGPYTERDPFHDPFVMFGYLAGGHVAHRAGDRRADPAPAPDRARRPAGGRRRPAHARAGPARRRHGLELRRVRRPRPGLRHPRSPASTSRSACCGGCGQNRW